MANFEEAFKLSMSQPPIYFAGRANELATLKAALVTGDCRTALIVYGETRGAPGGIGYSEAIQKRFLERDFWPGIALRLARDPDTIPRGAANRLRRRSFPRMANY
jgi:hypothetical protein